MQAHAARGRSPRPLRSFVDSFFFAESFNKKYTRRPAMRRPVMRSF
jgi:hypothetical protein